MSGRPWKPGQSGNPTGHRPNVTKTFRVWLQGVIKGDAGSEGTRMLAYLDRLDKIALNGEPRDSIAAIKFMVERAYGLPKESIELTAKLTDEQRLMQARKLAIETLRQLKEPTKELAAGEPGDGETEP